MIYIRNWNGVEDGPSEYLNKSDHREVSVQVSGEKGGGNIILSVSQDQLPFTPVFFNNTTDIQLVSIPVGARYKFSVTNSTPATNISISLLAGGK